MNLMVLKHVISIIIVGESTLFGTADSLTTPSEYRNLPLWFHPIINYNVRTSLVFLLLHGSFYLVFICLTSLKE